MVSYVYRTQEIFEWPIIWSNELEKNVTHKYNGKVYYHQVLEIKNCSQTISFKI